MFDLSGRTALVTGSSQGIGREIAKALSDRGASVFVHGAKPSEKLKAAAQMKLVESLAPNLAKHGVTINNIAPGAINTPRNAEALSDKEYLKKVSDSIPLGYVGDAKAMNGAALLLCSDEGSYITGSEMIVDGGMHL